MTITERAIAAFDAALADHQYVGLLDVFAGMQSAAGQALDEDALRLAVTAHARHVHTRYDELLMGGLERDAARERVWGEIQAILERWQAD